MPWHSSSQLVGHHSCKRPIFIDISPGRKVMRFLIAFVRMMSWWFTWFVPDTANYEWRRSPRCSERRTFKPPFGLHGCRYFLYDERNPEPTCRGRANNWEKVRFSNVSSQYPSIDHPLQVFMGKLLVSGDRSRLHIGISFHPLEWFGCWKLLYR